VAEDLTVAPTAGGPVNVARTARPGEPMLRWTSHVTSLEDVERELARIWAEPDLMVAADNGSKGRHIAARTSVMNLVVVTRQPEVGEHAAGIISRLTGRLPSRTLIVQSADPDGPSWCDARIQALCVLPRPDAPETCSELIFLTSGGEAGRHLSALVAPLLIHDLPVTIWWPGEPQLTGAPVLELLEGADRMIVDGSRWGGDGLGRLQQMAALYRRFDRLSIRDFALVRQSRWREAIATVFDLPEMLPYLGYLRRIAVTYGTHDATGEPGTTNVVKPLYHASWLASRLGLHVTVPMRPVDGPAVVARAGRTRRRAGEPEPMHHGLRGQLRGHAGEVTVVVRPVASELPPGTTLRVELLAERRGSELRVDVTAQAEDVHVHTWIDGIQAMDRTFRAPRRTDVDLLGEAIEIGGRDRLSMETITMAARMAEEPR
jgi:Glucose-6-phosphate dehydrogenase subunit N-terminal domain/Glucose-6-phosphate dehydrogenase subunit C-terminal domain